MTPYFGRPLLGLTLALATSGCLSIQGADLNAGLARYEVEPIDPVERLERPISVYVVCEDVMGGVVRPTKTSEAALEHGSYHSELFPLDPTRDRREQIEERAGDDQRDVLFGLEVEGVAESLGRLLQRRLSERFANVEVRVVRSLEGDQGVIVVTPEAEAYLEVIPTSEKQAFVRLKAQIDQGRAALVRGQGKDHVHRGHLIWAVPATVAAGTALGPPGLVAVQFGIQGLERRALENALVEGIDAAARKLAKQLAEEPERPVPVDVSGVSP
jgi:hypothetical protein